MQRIYKNKPLAIGVMTGFALVAAAFGCAHQNAALEQAQAEYMKATEDPNVAKYSAIHLHQAQEYLDKAEHTGNDEEMNHYIYLGKKHVEIARTEAERRGAEESLTDLQKSRDGILLKARTQEVEDVTRTAKVAEQRAQMSEREAAAANQRADELTTKVSDMQMKLSALNARETRRGLEMTLQGAFFEVDKADLKPGATHRLDTLAETLKQNAKRDVLIEGHTDSTGSDAHNLDLSQRRAESVATYLENHGVDSSRITAKGYGEAFPVVNNNTEAHRQQNRRVEIIILNEGQRGDQASR